MTGSKNPRRESSQVLAALCDQIRSQVARSQAALDDWEDVTYKLHIYELRQTPVFRKWIRGLKDQRAKEAIAKRMVRIEAGALGDTKLLAGGISEFRIHQGPGYRLYFVRRGGTVILLLCGGDKGSQERVIATAQQLAKEIDDEDHKV